MPPNGRGSRSVVSPRLTRLLPRMRHALQPTFSTSQLGGEQLAAVQYFTASVRNDPEAQRRQRMFVGALRASTSVEIVLGRFQQKQRDCRRCGYVAYL